MTGSAHLREKSAPGFMDTSIHRLAPRRTTVAEAAEVLGISAEACGGALPLEQEDEPVYLVAEGVRRLDEPSVGTTLRYMLSWSS
jgi:prolyl-tRNA editing enzyme YbaK/EbsC (Cys-tRNA(Pro) deacylase)